jgi:hypothetical protein
MKQIHILFVLDSMVKDDLPMRIQCSQWHLIACHQELKDKSCQMGSKRETWGVASVLPETGHNRLC